MTINKAALLAALKPKSQPFEIEDLGTIGITQLSVGEVEELRASVKARSAETPGKAYDFGLGLVAACVVDEQGNRLFDASDLPALVSSNQALIERLVTKAMVVNDFMKDESAKN